jgi:hypothetical protein
LRQGIGGYAVVVAGVHRTSRRAVAVKIMRVPAGNALRHPVRCACFCVRTAIHSIVGR